MSFYKKMKSYKHAYNVLHDLTGMNAKRNPNIGNLANNVLYAISQEKHINQDIHNCKGKVTSNIVQTAAERTRSNGTFGTGATESTTVPKVHPYQYHFFS